MTKKPIEILREIENLVDYKFDSLRSWAELEAWPLGVTMRIGDTINTKIHHGKNEHRFVTELLPRGEFDKHWHDCPEMCRVMANELVCKISNRTWPKDSIAVFSKGEPHVPANPSSTLSTWLEVTFTK